MGKDSLRIRSVLDLFEHMVHEPCFNQLRTKEQLGYRVDCCVRVTFKILGFSFTVQSAKYGPVYLEQRINAFVASVSKILVRLEVIFFSIFWHSFSNPNTTNLPALIGGGLRRRIQQLQGSFD